MRIDRLERSRHVRGRILAYLEDGSCLKLTEQELLDFGLRPGDELDDAALEQLRSSAASSQVRAQAAALIGRRAMSRADLEKKLRDKGASAEECRYAAEWLEAIGALNDREYAALLVRHCVDLGYGPARWREELRKHGIPRELWDGVLSQAPDHAAQIDRFLKAKLRSLPPDEAEKRRLSAALARRGFSWGEIKDAWSRLGDAADDMPSP